MNEQKRGRKKRRDEAAPPAVATDTTIAACGVTQESMDQPRRKRQRRTVGSPASGAVPRSQVTMAQFPDLVLMLIFSFLDEQDKAAVARVCSNWRNLVYSRSLWRHVTADLHLDTLSSADLASLKKRGIRKVLVRSGTDPWKVEELLHTVPMLEAFDALCIRLNERRLKSVFFPALSNMRSLKLQVTRINAEICKHIADHLANLEDLELVGPQNQTILSDIGTLNQVKILVIDSSNCHNGVPTIPPQPVEMPRLQQLSLWGSIFLDAHLCYLKGAFPNLHELNVDFCCCGAQEGFGHLAERTELHTLGIRCQCASLPLESISNLKNLQVLVLDCRSINSADLKFLGQLPALKELWLTVELLKEEGWRCFSQGFPVLEILSLSNLRRLSKRDAEYLGQLPCLEEVEIRGPSGNLDIQGMCQTLHKLKALTLGCRLTDDGLRAVAQMPTLEVLDLSESTLVCEKGLRHLSEGRAPLQFLRLQGTHFTSQGLLQLADGPQTLRELEVQHFNDRVDGLPELLQRNRSLRTVRARMSASMKRTLKQLRPDVVIERIHICKHLPDPLCDMSSLDSSERYPAD